MSLLSSSSLDHNPPPRSPSAPLLAVQSVVATQKWIPADSKVARVKQQIVRVTLNNFGSSADQASWITVPHTVELVSPQFNTTMMRIIKRLRTGDQARLQLGFNTNHDITPGSNGTVQVVMKNVRTGRVVLKSAELEIQGVGLTPYTADIDSLGRHLRPDWYDDAKFGIFIHWGVYNVPAWAPTVAPLSYAESGKSCLVAIPISKRPQQQQRVGGGLWSRHVPNSTSSPTWVHHKETYGTEFVYDDFIPQWKAEAWDPNEWLELFTSAGAKYFVLTSKHHDGFALFDTGASSHRNSLILGPKRDFVGELFAASRLPQWAGKIVPNLYYSLPEWLNPDYAKYGFGSWPGGDAHNAYDYSEIEPYAGHIPVADYVDDIIFPQMEKILFQHNTSIMWYDIGGANQTPELASRWFNEAAERGEQVVINDRCGVTESDMDTPELTTFTSIQQRKWESCEGIDPHSFGFNSATLWENYKNSTTVLHNLIDIASKNGNYLLDVGPTANGTIIEPMAKPLREVGLWLKHSGDAIYGTTYFYLGGTSEGANIRFTTKPDAFYIISLLKPVGTLSLSSPIPAVEGDTLTMLGGSGKILRWSVDEVGFFTIEVDESEVVRVDLAWAFKLDYGSGR